MLSGHDPLFIITEFQSNDLCNTAMDSGGPLFGRAGKLIDIVDTASDTAGELGF